MFGPRKKAGRKPTKTTKEEVGPGLESEIVKEKKKKETRTDNVIGANVTINDFANTLRIHARLKKSATNMSNKVKQVTTVQEEEQVWDETNEDTLLKDKTKGRRNRERRKSKYQKDDDEDEGIDYPLDMWFAISEYIQPEAVGKFARICKTCYYITTTAKFWIHLYKSHCKFVPDLPEHLQPQCMRLYGLRACVIRALHYGYFRTSERNEMSYLRQHDLQSLVKRKCTLMWHKEGKQRWYFYFKLMEASKSRSSSLKQSRQCTDKETEFFDTLKDVAVNPENDCKVLRVSCLKYSMVPLVIGLTLQTVTTDLMPGFREHRFQLGFGTSGIPNTLTNQVILRNVMEYHILNWWDPAYPHQDIGYAIELPQNDSWD
ncbi:PREDICTED: transmembrane protein 183 isoform X2 [Vollenhovia emeryi]|uniref:transmembrane protein 183 isoform X2 n=1 Tax=Vollenhovia emeryi TaxID=411798 RepID=UPI0005F5020F|nr:PREDICTED: transmembrane protein 183 isoform X2 [Vollenhovia emeryi]